MFRINRYFALSYRLLSTAFHAYAESVNASRRELKTALMTRPSSGKPNRAKISWQPMVPPARLPGKSPRPRPPTSSFPPILPGWMMLQAEFDQARTRKTWLATPVRGAAGTDLKISLPGLNSLLSWRQLAVGDVKSVPAGK
jgi:hypothetical protein